MGACPIATIRQTVAAVGRRSQTSAVCGDLPMQPETIRAKAREIAATGVDYVKIGFFPADNTAACAWALAPLSRKVKADRGPVRRSANRISTFWPSLPSTAFTA